MIKAGLITYKKRNLTLYISYNTSVGKGELLALYNSLDEYKDFNTSGAIAAYYFKGKEFIKGDSSLIEETLHVLNSMSNVSGSINQTTEFVAGCIQTKEEKRSLDGKTYTITLKNGCLSDEEFDSEDYHLDLCIMDYNNQDSLMMQPVDIYDYVPSTIVKKEAYVNLDGVDFYSLDYLKTIYDLDHIEDYDYVVVQSLEEARERLKEWQNASAHFKAIDIETTGLGVGIYGKDLITGVSISYDWEEVEGAIENSTYFPFRQEAFSYNLPLEFMYELVEAVVTQPDSVSILAYNGVMERNGFFHEGYNIRVDQDPMVLSQLIDTKQMRGLHSLKGRADSITGLKWLELSEIFIGKKIAFNVLPIELVKYYACPDCPNTIKVMKALMKRLPKSEYWTFAVDNKLVEAKACQEFYGLRINETLLQQKLEKTVNEMEILADLFRKIHKTSKNINSPIVLREIIYNQLGCTPPLYTITHKPSTSKFAIDAIVEKGAITVQEGTRIPNDILDKDGKIILAGKDLAANKYMSLVIYQKYKLLTKKKSMFERMKKKSAEGRLMFRINGQGAASGRQTSDAHQYPDDGKELILADTPDHTLISCDYSQVELRILAAVIQDERLIKMMSDPHIDIHRAFLNVITGIPIHLISAVMRSLGKRVNFGVVYGLSGYGLAKDRYGLHYTQEQLRKCEQDIIDFYNSIPRLKQKKERDKEFIRKNGYIETELGYRRIMYGALKEDITEKELAAIYRQGLNTPIQGYGAYLMKMAENNYTEYIKNMGWDKTVEYKGKQYPLVRLMLSIHDEVLISAHNSIPREEIIKMCKICQEIEIKGAPPYYAVPTFVDNWYQGKADEYEMSVVLRDEILENWEKGISIIDWSDYVGSIKKWKLRQITNYMTDLISKYKTEEEVLPHITHPEYTHTLIAIYVDKKFVKEHSMEECIAEALHSYIVQNGIPDTVDFNSESRSADDDIKAAMDPDVLDFIEYDDNGDIIPPDSSEEEDEDVEDDDMDTYIYREEQYKKEGLGPIYMSDTCVIDVSLIADKETLSKFYEELNTLADQKGFYKIFLMRGANMLPTPLRMEFAKSEIEELLRKYI